MKLLKESNLVVNQSGTVKIVPEEPGDVWIVYNLIAPGDVVTATTTRKVTGGSGKASNSRVRLSLEILITAVDYQKDSSTVRVQGKNRTATQHVQLGSFHTIQIEVNKEFEIWKKIWDPAAVERLREGCDRTSGADLAVVLFQPNEVARLFLVGPRARTMCAEVDSGPNPNKRFFESVFGAFVKNVDLGVVRCVVLGSQGNEKEEFRRFLIGEAQRLKLKAIENNKSRIVLVNNACLQEVLHDSAVRSLIKDTKVAMEIKAHKEFSDLVLSSSDRMCYGAKNVEMAHELMAIETLLITNELFESEEIATRRRYARFVKSVKEAGGNAFVFSAKFAGDVLTETGIAAILRFPIPDLENLVL